MAQPAYRNGSGPSSIVSPLENMHLLVLERSSDVPHTCSSVSIAKDKNESDLRRRNSTSRRSGAVDELKTTGSLVECIYSDGELLTSSDIQPPINLFYLIRR